MKVLFDHQIFEKQKFGGISRYFVELIKLFDQNESLEWRLPLKYSENNYLTELPTVKPQLFAAVPHYRASMGDRLIKKIQNKVSRGEPVLSVEQQNRGATIEMLLAGDYDIFHPTFYEDYFLDYLQEKPFVLTVHDLIHQVFPEYFIGDKAADKTKRLLIRANHIIAISQQTKNDLVEFFNIPDDKITVIYHGCSFNPKVGDERNIIENLPDKYFLFVGNRNLYKNVYFAIEAIADFLKANPDIYVVCTGHPFSVDEVNFFYKLDLSEKIRYIFTDDKQLTYLYKHAIAFVYPTLYEGFGLPILEAFACGCPVLSSNSSSLPEVGGDAVIYFNPKSKSSILKAIEDISNDKTPRDIYTQRGFSRLANFSWDYTAFQTVKVYEQVLSKE